MLLSVNLVKLEHISGPLVWYQNIMANSPFTTLTEYINQVDRESEPRNNLFIFRSFSKFVLQKFTGSIYFVEKRGYKKISKTLPTT